MVATLTSRKRLTAEEFAEQYMDVLGCELERGEVIHLPPAGWDHGLGNGNAQGLVYVWARKTGLGRVLAGEAGIVTGRDPDTVRGADVAYFSYERLPKGQERSGFSTVPPELVIEVVGEGRTWKRLVEKTGEYLRMGVDRVWVLDPAKQTVYIFSGDGPPVVLGGEDEVRDEQILPGFSCRVREFFED